MLIAVAKSRVDDAGAARIEKFLAGLLPQLDSIDGVVASYHYRDPAISESVTLLLWRDEAALDAFRRSEVVTKIAAFEAAEKLDVHRGLFELSYPLG